MKLRKSYLNKAIYSLIWLFGLGTLNFIITITWNKFIIKGLNLSSISYLQTLTILLLSMILLRYLPVYIRRIRNDIKLKRIWHRKICSLSISDKTKLHQELGLLGYRKNRTTNQLQPHMDYPRP